MKSAHSIFDIKIVFSLFGYILIAILFTYPLIFKITSHLPGVPGDVYQFIWAFWHFKKSLLAGINPYVTELMFYPLITNLILHTWTPAKCLMAMPISTLTGNWIFSYNLLFLFSFVASALGAFLLVLRYTTNPLLAFAGGVIFAFAPNQMAHAHGHLNIISTEAIPWLVLIWQNYEKKFRYSTLVGLVLLAVYQFLCEYQLFIFIMMLLFVYIIYKSKTNITQYKNEVIKLLPPLAGFFVLLAPFWLMAITVLGEYNVMAIHGPRWGMADRFSIDVLHLIMPSGLHPIWGQLVESLSQAINLPAQGAERNAFLGYLVIAFIIIALIKCWHIKAVRFWSFAGAVFLVLAFGPLLKVANISINSIPGLYLFSFHGIKVILPMPYTLIHYLPVLNGMRIPARFIIMTILSASILFAIAGDYLMRSLKMGIVKKYILSIGIVVIVLFEYLPAPFPVFKPVTPQVYDIIKQDEKIDNIVLDFPAAPWDWTDIDSLYNQTYHEHKIVGGWTARMSASQKKYFYDYNIIKEVNLGREVESKAFEDMLKALNIRYVITRNGTVRRVVENMQNEITGFYKLAESENAQLWIYSP